jgi:DNA-binding PadR family transcriptional regulator
MPDRITKPLLRVVETLADDPGREWYGLELMEAARLSSGTLYPILHRLVADGWLERTRDVPSDRGGTGRRMYKLTGHGALAARELLSSRAPRASVAPLPRTRVQPA